MSFDAVEETSPAAGRVLLRDGPATPAHATRLRDVIADWARAHRLPPGLVEDVKLAAYEALANIVQHAYPAAGESVMTLTAHLHDTLTVSVRDCGRWRENHSKPCGGHGLPLIRALVPETSITCSPTGTTIAMAWPLR